MKTRELLTLTLVSFFLLASVLLVAGTLTNTNPPIATGHTLTDIYNLIHNTPASSHNLYPSVSPTATSSYSISELYADLANLIKRENLETGVTYLGVTGDYGNPDPAYATTTVIASSLTPTSLTPQATGYTLTDIYNLIHNATTTPASTSFSPGTPAASQYTLDEIYTELSTLIDPVKVGPGVTYLGQAGSFVFTGPYGVTFSTADANGSLSASVNSIQINSGDKVEASSSITFTAAPSDGYFVAEWSVNGVVQSGQTNKEFIFNDLQTNTEVIVSFVDYSTWLLLDMPFEAGSDNSSTPDLSGNDNSGTVIGPIWSDSAGHNGTGGYLFNRNYITLGAKPTFQNLSEVSVEVWVKPTFLWGGGTGNRIMCVRPWGWVAGKWCLYFYSANSIHWSVLNSAGNATEGVYSNGSAFALNEWYHIVATYNGSSIIVYVNGNPGSYVGSLTGTIFSANLPIEFGYTGGDYFNGYIDEVKIYNKGLTAEQVNILYNR